MTDNEIIAFAHEFRNGILDKRSPDGMCFAVCFPLATLLSINGLACKCEELDFGWANHYIIRLQDNRILDPTYDQWDGTELGTDLPPVYLGNIPRTFASWSSQGN